MKHIYCVIEKCLACRSCELACAAAHTVSRPRIHVQAIDDKGALHRVRTIALQCRYCADPACAAACISGGIRRNDETGDIILRMEKCVGCWSCIMVCPIGAIKRNQESHQALKCDRCPDLETPACVTACPTRALVLEEPGTMEKG